MQMVVDKKYDWTVMVFMGADNPPGDRPLAGAAEDDLKEMEGVGSNAKVAILTQLHLPNQEPVRYAIGPKGNGRGQPIPIDDYDPNTGDPHVLAKFALWAHDHYPAEHYMLVLWGHAYRWAFGYYRNPLTHAVDGLNFCEISDVLTKFTDERLGGEKLDIIAFDACDISSIEVAHQVQHIANYLISSQIGVPLPGWPYHTILKRLTESPGMDPDQLGAYIVRRFVRNYGEGPSSLTMLDLKRTPEVSVGVAALTSALYGLSQSAMELERVRRLFTLSQVMPRKPFVDLADLCANLARFCGDPAIRTAAADLGNLLIRSNSPFIAEHGKNSYETTKLQGVNIYAPHIEPRHDWRTLVDAYSSLALSDETGWGEFVFVLASPN
jgi:hypothetical protein